MKTLTTCFALLVLFLSAPTIQAQTEPQDTTTKQLFLVTKTDGGQFYGYIIEDDGREILLETKNIGKLYISKGDIASIVKIADNGIANVNGDYTDYRNEGPFTTRYYLTTNALPIKKAKAMPCCTYMDQRCTLLYQTTFLWALCLHGLQVQ